MRFEQYPLIPELQRSLAEAGFRKPTDIQFKAIPSILKGEDVLAIAQTGTGKTAAFAIPVLQRLARTKAPHPKANTVRCLVMVPTRELAQQIYLVFKQLARYTPLKIAHLIGGVADEPQIKALKQGLDVLISTPGRLFDLNSRGWIQLPSVRILILDEADQMLALGFIRDIRDVVRQLSPRHQTLFFSATINEEIKDLAYSIVRNPIRIQLSPKDPVSKNIQHAVLKVAMDDKRFYLERLIRDKPEAKILVFVRTRVRAERVAAAMARAGLESSTLHGEKDQTQRQMVLDEYRKASSGVLIATDVSARGIDIPQVQLVVNYDLPDHPETYVHRVGRTGRGHNRGLAYTFCAPEETHLLKVIETYIGKPVHDLQIDKETHKMTLALSEAPTESLQDLLRAAGESGNSWQNRHQGKKGKPRG